MMMRTLLGAALLGGLLLVAAAPYAQDDQAAQAAMDHAALAASYQAEAQAAQAKVAEHEKMLERYERLPMIPKGSATLPKEAMIKHCQKLIESYEAAAAEATDLAKAHQEMAAASK